eukprot:scaffold41992_cov168-Amphora_coffeaeformis.AAC.1
MPWMHECRPLVQSARRAWSARCLARVALPLSISPLSNDCWRLRCTTTFSLGTVEKSARLFNTLNTEEAVKGSVAMIASAFELLVKREMNCVAPDFYRITVGRLTSFPCGIGWHEVFLQQKKANQVPDMPTPQRNECHFI